MRFKEVLVLLVYAAGFSACDTISIFDSGDSTRETSSASADSVMLRVEISGGIAGVQQELLVHDSGAAVFEDSFRPGTRWTRQLSVDELARLKMLMQQSGFFDLDSAYVNHQVADAFIYTIFYRDNEKSHTVVTDDVSAPANLHNIVAGLVQVVEATRNNGLDLSLRLSRSEMRSGESVEMTLLVTNKSEAPLTLRFRDGQIFDFSAIVAPPAAEQVVWNWAHDKVFTEALWEMALAPGERKSYAVTWQGNDNAGVAVTGQFVIRADLVSVPGGSPEQKGLVIGE
ncbi:MAG: protealysin inhibitor emfourin [bacterium]